MIDDFRFKEIMEVYLRFRGGLAENANDAGLLTQLYFGCDLTEQIRALAHQASRAETEKQEFWEWRKKDPHAITKPPGSR